MKFGKQFETQQVPEWRDAYMDYRQLKLLVKDMDKLRKQEQRERQEQQPVNRMPSLRRLVSKIPYGHHHHQNGNNINDGHRSVPHSPRNRSVDEGAILIELENRDPTELEEHEEDFFRILDDELCKVDRFYEAKEEELINQARALDVQMEALVTARGNIDELGAGDEIRLVSGEDVKQVKFDIPAAKPADALALLVSELANPSVLNMHTRRLKRAEEMLRQAFVEFYRGLYILRNFGSLNMIAFVKILKKFEKVTGRKLAKNYLQKVQSSHIGQSDKVQKLLEKVEVLFTKHFTGYDRSKAMRILRPGARKERHRVTFFVGVFTGLSAALLLGLILTVRVQQIYAKPEYSAKYMDAVFPLFSMTTVIMLHLFLYGVNIYTWRKTRINHTFILGLRRQSELQFRDVFLITTGLSTLALSGLILHLQVTAGDNRCCDSYEEAIPLIVLGGMFLLLFLPFNILYRSTRAFFLRSAWQCLLTPLYKVTITDFLLADQLTSQVQALRDFEYVLCYYGGGFFRNRDSKACLANKTFISFGFLMAVLPYWCRVMQCLRRWYDEKDIMQVFNAFKYFSTILAVALRLAYSYNKKNFSLLILSIITSAASTVLSTYWDIVQDWGLLKRNCENPWLREKLAIKYKFVYYFAMVSNVILRFAWLQSLISIKIPHIHQKALSLIVACLEVVRRGQWNYFRLENEHFNNVGKFRAVKTVPLPFID